MNPGAGVFRFSVLHYDTMEEHTFAVDSERELDSWTAALYGDDQLHKSASLENSPSVPRRVSGSTFYTPSSPGSLRASVGSKDSVTEEDADDGRRDRSFTEPFTILDQEDASSISGSIGGGIQGNEGGGCDSERSKGTGDDTSATVSLVSIDMLRDPSLDRVDTPDSLRSNEHFIISGSTSSLSSMTTTTTTVSNNTVPSSSASAVNINEVDGPTKAPTKSSAPPSSFAIKLRALTEEPVKFSSPMLEIMNAGGGGSTSSTSSLTKIKLFVVLRKTVLELYKNEQDKTPLSVTSVANIEICEEDSNICDKNQVTLRLLDSSGTADTSKTTNSNKIYLIAPDDSVRATFVRDIKKSARSLKRQKNPRHSVTMSILKKRLGSADKIKELKSKKDKRISMLLVNDDLVAIEKYEDINADQNNIMSGKEMLSDLIVCIFCSVHFI